MIQIILLTLLLSNLYSMGVEIIRDKISASDSITLGITGEIGETIPIVITERVFTEGLNSKDEVKKYAITLTKRLNEVLVKRAFENDRYRISVTSKDLGITYSYEFISRFVGMPPMVPTEGKNGIRIFQFDTQLFLGEQYYPRVFLKWGNG